jgi:hypothetical protein
MFDIVYNDGVFDVIFSGAPAGQVVVSLHTLEDAQDHIAYLKWERDNAFSEYGSEFDIEVY